ncbi:MAG: hypothetical protein DMD63_05170 [Gemmatimonadetes bacterium]|nr:MAG: hypothetical protein DMD63_05170 [Gemmatimonadota bacterium]
MAARNSLDTGSGKDSKEKAIKTARAVLDGKMGIIEGARLLSTLAPDLVPDWNFLVLAALDSETDDLPVGKERKLWDATALAERDPVISQIEADAKQEVEVACRNILRRFDPAS